MLQISILSTINEVTNSKESLCARHSDQAQENINHARENPSL